MGQSTNDAVVLDAQIKLGREEYVLSMEQREKSNDVAVTDAQT